MSPDDFDARSAHELRRDIFTRDEPIELFFEAAAQLPEVRFHVTGTIAAPTSAFSRRSRTMLGLQTSCRTQTMSCFYSPPMRSSA